MLSFFRPVQNVAFLFQLLLIRLLLFIEISCILAGYRVFVFMLLKCARKTIVATNKKVRLSARHLQFVSVAHSQIAIQPPLIVTFSAETRGVAGKWVDFFSFVLLIRT